MKPPNPNKIISIQEDLEEMRDLFRQLNEAIGGPETATPYEAVQAAIAAIETLKGSLDRAYEVVADLVDDDLICHTKKAAEEMKEKRQLVNAKRDQRLQALMAWKGNGLVGEA